MLQLKGEVPVGKAGKNDCPATVGNGIVIRNIPLSTRSLGKSLVALRPIAKEIERVDFVPIKDGAGRKRGAGATDGYFDGVSVAQIQPPIPTEYHGTSYRGSGFMSQTAGAAGFASSMPMLCEAVRSLLTTLDGIGVYQLLVNRLKPHGELGLHRDGPISHVQRWHLPVVTNPEVEWWDEDNGTIRFLPGSWWGPVPFTNLHSMVNLGLVYRIHVLADLFV